MVKHLHEYCVGNPRSLISSHSGNVNIAISFQEQPLFLPANPPREQEEWSEESSSGANPSSSGRANGDNTNSTNQSDELPSYETEQEAMGTVLRGSVIVKLQKPTKIRCLSLDLYGVSRTFWNLVPQPGVLGDTPLPSNAEIEDVTYFGCHHWDFIHADQLKQASTSFQKQCEGMNATLIATDLYGASATTKRGSLHVEEAASTVTVQSTGKEGVPTMVPIKPAVRKVKQFTPNVEGMVYPAGEYVYHFSIIIHRDSPETVSVPNGSVRYFLVPKIVRAGAFNSNISGSCDLEVVRAPLTSSGLLVYNPASLSRVWDNRLAYSISLNQRYITLDVPTNLTLSLMALPDSNVMVHQVRIYLLESVKYLYSPDSSIQAAHSSLKLVLFQQNASVETQGDSRTVGSVLTSPDPMHFDCEILVATKSNRAINELPQAYGRGKMGEKRFVEPDHTSQFITVRHRLIVTLRVSKFEDDKRQHFEIKVDTPITLLSKHCVQENIYLPQYDASAPPAPHPQDDDIEEYDDGGLPSFHESMDHQVLSSARGSEEPANTHRDVKFTVAPTKTPEADRDEYFQSD